MPSALVDALAAPIREVCDLVGPGWSGRSPAAALAEVRDALADVSAAGRAAWARAGAGWSGAAADGAADHTAAAAAAAAALAERADLLGRSSRVAGDAVSRAAARLRDVLQRFEARAAALEPHLDSPGTAEELIAEAQRALREAIAIVDALHADLDAQAATISARVPASTVPAGFGGGAGWPALGAAGAAPLGRAVAEGRRTDRPQAAVPAPDPAAFGDGVELRLPDGSTVTAPNAVAASAVRHALTQLGVPYRWGGTTPGVGLDCSGLTQWAYGEAGLGLPRLAQEQDIGAAVSRDALRPGDLAVWDGHVAMIVGHGLMVEAGDPVQLSPIRTTNAGQGFQGFWRPTG